MNDEVEHRLVEISEKLFSKLTLATDKYQSAHARRSPTNNRFDQRLEC